MRVCECVGGCKALCEHVCVCENISIQACGDHANALLHEWVSECIIARLAVWLATEANCKCTIYTPTLTLGCSTNKGLMGELGNQVLPQQDTD